jgi:hypothetical protein
MTWAARLSAEGVVLLHFAFVLFVLAGGLLVLRRPRIAWLHLPAAAWGAAIEFGGWICPLTPLEQALRRRAGLAPYEGGFLDHYIFPLLYPDGLTPDLQASLGAAVLVLNAGVYALVLRKRRRGARRARGAQAFPEPAARSRPPGASGR